MTNEDIKELYDRMRMTEVETRTQNERINALTQRVDSMLERWDKHMSSMWKLVYVLVGALISLALGPKVAEKIVSATSGHVQYRSNDIIPWHGERDIFTQNKA